MSNSIRPLGGDIDPYRQVHGPNFIGVGTPEDIVFEITETRSTYPADLAVDVVHALRKAGMLRDGL